MKEEERRLKEKLIPFSEDILDRAAERSKNLKDLLETKVQDLPFKYRNLFSDQDYFFFKNLSLKQTLLNLTETSHTFCFLSETSDDDIEGFAMYYCNPQGTLVHEMTIISFLEDSNNWVLARDVVRLLNYLQDKYLQITFSCRGDQPVLKHYMKEVKERKGTWDYDEDEDSYIFDIPGRKIIERLNRKNLILEENGIIKKK